MSEQAAAVAWLAFRTELDEATQTIYDRFDELLAEGILPGREKHKPGGVDHDQSRHGRRGGRPGRQEAVATGTITKGDKKYTLHRSYGNINGAKAYIKRTTAANPGLELEYFRHEGKYYVGEPMSTKPTPKNPPNPEPTGRKKPTYTKIRRDPEYSRTGLPDPKYVDYEKMTGWRGEQQLSEKERQKIRPNANVTQTVKGNIEGDGTPLQKKQVAQILAQLPLEHQQQLNYVYVHNDSGLGKYGASSERTVGYAESRAITIAGKRGYAARSKTVAHEVGHVIMSTRVGLGTPVAGETDSFRSRRRETKRKLGRLWWQRADHAGIRPLGTGKFLSDSDARRMKAVTKYAKGDPGEFIAESYGHYVTKPSVLKRTDPEAYAILRDDLFQGQEYPDLSVR